MVFGHYSITIKTLKMNEIPPQLPIERGAAFIKIVRVFHILWIPIFPFEKSWAIEKGGNKYKLNPQAERLLDKFHGKVKTPWYAFAGPVLGIALAILMSIGSSVSAKASAKRSVERNEKAKTEKFAKIDAPAENDYYTIYSDGVEKVLKVTNFTNDSILFAVPTTEKKTNWRNKGWKVGYFENPNAFTRPQMVAKADLKNAVSQDTKNPYSFKGSVVPGLMYNGKVVLREVERIDISTVKNIQYIDEIAHTEVRRAFMSYISSSNNIDSSLLLMDMASKEYFTSLLKTAKEGDMSKMKAFISDSKNPLVTYKYMLYTNYSYLNATKKETPKSAEEELSDFSFYLKLVGQGLWMIDFGKAVLENVKISRVSFSGSDQAKLTLTAPSNNLDRESTIYFSADFNKEGDQWKINIPSTFSYTKKQIQQGIHGFDRNKQFRKMVRDEILEIDGVDSILAEWDY